MRLSGLYVWGMGTLWAVVVAAALGVLAGGVLGFLFGMFGIETMDAVPSDPLSLLPIALLFAAFGGALGLLYGLVIGGLTGAAAAGVFAALMVQQHRQTVPSTAQVSLEAAGIGVAVQTLAAAVVVLVAGSVEILLWWVPLAAVSAVAGAVIGPLVVRSALRRGSPAERTAWDGARGR